MTTDFSQILPTPRLPLECRHVSPRYPRLDHRAICWLLPRFRLCQGCVKRDMLGPHEFAQIRQDQFPENGRAAAFPSPDFRSRRLVTARRRLAMSQGELAIRLGVDQSTASRLERGEMQSPPWKLIVQACLHLELEPHALLDMVRNKNLPALIDHTGARITSLSVSG